MGKKNVYLLWGVVLSTCVVAGGVAKAQTFNNDKPEVKQQDSEEDKGRPGPAPSHPAPEPYRPPAPAPQPYRPPAPAPAPYRPPAPAPQPYHPSPVPIRPPTPNPPHPVVPRPPVNPVHPPAPPKPIPEKPTPAPTKPGEPENPPLHPVKPPVPNPVGGSPARPGHPIVGTPTPLRPPGPMKPQAPAGKPTLVGPPVKPLHVQAPVQNPRDRFQQPILDVRARENQLAQNERARNIVGKFQNRFDNGEHWQHFRDRESRFQNLRNRWAQRYAFYHDWGFYGGFYWEVAPCVTISTYFYNPVIYWLYADDNSESSTVYSSWYDDDSVTVEPFMYPNVLYPTNEIRDIGEIVTSYSTDVQTGFQNSLTYAIQALGEDVANQLNAEITLPDGSVTINQYQFVYQGNDQTQAPAALVLQGFVDYEQGDQSVQFAFKAFLDLANPDQTIVFVPSSPDGQPTDEDEAVLSQINQRLRDLGALDLGPQTAN